MSNFEKNLKKYADELGIQLEGGLTTGITPATTPTVGTTVGNTLNPMASADPVTAAIANHPAVKAAQKQAQDAAHSLAQAHMTAIKDVMSQTNTV